MSIRKDARKRGTALMMGKTVEFEGMTLKLTYINTAKMRFTFEPDPAKKPEGADGVGT